MSTQITFANTVLLGFIAGATISLGLLLGRMKAPAPRFRALLNAIAIGILLFLFVDVLHGAIAQLEVAIDTHNHGLTFLRTVLVIGGLALGLEQATPREAHRSIRRKRVDAGRAHEHAARCGHWTSQLW